MGTHDACNVLFVEDLSAPEFDLEICNRYRIGAAGSVEFGVGGADKSLEPHIEVQDALCGVGFCLLTLLIEHAHVADLERKLYRL